MKNMKKVASFLLVLVMVLGLATTAFAAGETGSITVDNPREGVDYTAYKIFDVTYDKNEDGTAGTHYAYTIDLNSAWFNVVATYSYNGTVESKIDGLTFTKVTDTNTFIVTKGEGFSAASFADTLSRNVGDKGGITLRDATVNGKSVKQETGLDLGYYFVASSTGALCNLTTTYPNATIHDKNDVPFDKVDDQESVDVGQVVNYTITGKVPDYTGFTSYKYEITDKMTSGLTFNNNVKVFIDGVEITENFTLKTGDGAGDKAFILNIDVMKLTIGAKIEVKYSATVNANAITKIERNHATLEFSNDPANDKSTDTREDEETVYSAKIVINKYDIKFDASAAEGKLAGAKFKLYKEVTEGEGTSATTTKKYYKYDGNKVEWVNKEQADEKVTDSNGVADFVGLQDGTYYLEETEAPAGYNLLEKPVEVKIEGRQLDADGNPVIVDKKPVIVVGQLTQPADVANNTGSILPNTGGMGTTIFYVVGSILLFGAVVLLVTKKRMSVAK